MSWAMIKASVWSALEPPKTFCRISLHPFRPHIGSTGFPISPLVYFLNRFYGLLYLGFTFRAAHVPRAPRSPIFFLPPIHIPLGPSKSSPLMVSDGVRMEDSRIFPSLGRAGMPSEKVIMGGFYHSISMAIFLGLILLNLGMAMNNTPSLTFAWTLSRSTLSGKTKDLRKCP